VVRGLFDVIYRYRGREVGPVGLCGQCLETLRENDECEVELVGRRGDPRELWVIAS